MILKRRIGRIRSVAKKGGHQTIETNMMLMMMIKMMIRSVAKKGGHHGQTIEPT